MTIYCNAQTQNRKHKQPKKWKRKNTNRIQLKFRRIANPNLCGSNWNLDWIVSVWRCGGEKQHVYKTIIWMCFGARCVCVCVFWWKSSHDPAISVNEQWFVTHSITLFRKNEEKKNNTTTTTKSHTTKLNWTEVNAIHRDDEKEIGAVKWSFSWIACIFFIVPSASLSIWLSYEMSEWLAQSEDLW